MASKGVNGTSIAVTLAGVVLAYSGVKGKKITTTVQSLIAGNNPADTTGTDLPITLPNVGGDASGSSSSGFSDFGPTATGRLSPAQIYGYAIRAGFNPISAVVATAVAMAESGGYPNSHNAKPPDDSYGLWQINMLGSLGPARRAQFGLSSNAELFDPSVNARAAYAISSGGRNFGAWTTYTSGAYKQYLPQARAASHG